MQGRERRQRIKDGVQLAVIVVLCLFATVADFLPIRYVKDGLRNAWISKIVGQTVGGVAAVLIMLRLRIRLFSRPKNLLYLLPCLLVAVDNFQFFAFFSGKMELVRTQAIDFILFGLYTFSVGFFEECIFRGVLFSVLAGVFAKTKKGFLGVYVGSSVIFGLAHLFNGFSAATLLQVGYTVLTGGLFAFCLIKTRNILCCACTHGLYNFCGLLFGAESGLGLGTGVVLDLGTVLTMLVVSLLVGAFVIWKTLTYPDEERIALYRDLGVLR